MLAIDYWSGLEGGPHPMTSWTPHIADVAPVLRLGIVAAMVLVCFVIAQLAQTGPIENWKIYARKS